MRANRRSLACAALLLALAGCGTPDRAAAPELVQLTGPTMGTTWQVKLAALPQGTSRDELQDGIEQLLDRVNDLMSTYRPDSELSRFNRYEGPEWFEVSAETVKVAAAAQQISGATGGAFDVTVGPLVNLWDFGPDQRDRRVPGDDELAKARARVGYEMLEVRDDPPALRKSRPDLYVDLSAIAKGFGVDQVAEHLDRIGSNSYFVEIGGEIRTRGAKPGGDPWRIGIEAPTADRLDAQSARRILELHNRAVATSGDYRNYWEKDGRRFSHTIDPRTGRPVEHQLASVTVVADDCMTADGWATALMVLGPDEAYNSAVQQGLAALFIIREEEGFVERSTPPFAADLK